MSEFMDRLHNFIQDIKIHLNEHDNPEARKALNRIIEITDRIKEHDEATNQDSDSSHRANQGQEQPLVDAAFEAGYGGSTYKSERDRNKDF